jgi:hypothetical protein
MILLQRSETFRFGFAHVNGRQLMLDPQLQERFSRSCTDAAFGYTAATTAAYANFADQILNFWAGVLSPPAREPARSEVVWGWPTPARRELASVPFLPFAWPIPQPQSAPALFPSAVYGPFAAWLNMFSYTAPPAAWPMAFMMMASGVPRSVAWPAAEANVAVMDAADAAAASVRKVYSSYRTEGGHSVGRQVWPSAHLTMLALLLPLSVGTMMTTLRVG